VTKKSFTLIEMLVVMMVIVIMSSIGIISYKGQEKRDIFDRAVLQFVSDIRDVQNMAMSATQMQDKDICDKYGIKIADDNKSYQTICSRGGTDTVIKTIVLP